MIKKLTKVSFLSFSTLNDEISESFRNRTVPSPGTLTSEKFDMILWPNIQVMTKNVFLHFLACNIYVYVI